MGTILEISVFFNIVLLIALVLTGRAYEVERLTVKTLKRKIGAIREAVKKL